MNPKKTLDMLDMANGVFEKIVLDSASRKVRLSAKEHREYYFEKYSEDMSAEDREKFKVALEEIFPDPSPGSVQHYLENNTKKVVVKLVAKIMGL